MYQKAKEFLAQQLNIEVNKIIFSREQQFQGSPNGYKLQMDTTAIFYVKDGLKCGDMETYYVKCPVPSPASYQLVSIDDVDDFMNVSIKQTLNLSGKFTESDPEHGQGWLSIEHCVSNKLPLDNVFTTYEYLMGCNGIFKGKPYKKYDVLRSPEHYDKNNLINFDDVSHVRTFKLGRK
jgi:hypothetical protein